MLSLSNNLKELPQVGVTSLHRSVGSATSTRGDNFIMNNEQVELYKLYHSEQNIELRLELAKKICELNKAHPVQEFWNDLITHNLEGEEWALIKQWRNHYEASTYGRIRCWYNYANGAEIKLNTPRLIKQHLNKDEGYLLCGINISKKHNTSCKVNWLVANAFYDNIENLPQSNHIDGVKTNNYTINLELCSRSYNMKHAHFCGLHPFSDNDNHHQRNFTKKDVADIMGSKLPHKDLAEKYNVSYNAIIRVRRGSTYKHISNGVTTRFRIAKLSHDLVLDIFNSKNKTSEICKKFNVKDYVVQRIKSGQTFSNITGKKYTKI